MHYIFLPVDLTLFDGAAATGDGAGTGATGETQASSDSTRRSATGETQRVLYGKQPKAESDPSDAGEETTADVITTSNTLEERRKAYRDLVNSDEYKDLYTEDTQRIINDRFKQVKTLQESVDKSKPIIDMMLQKYKIADGDMGKLAQAVENDDAYWSEDAEKAGMNVEQYKKYMKLQRDNQQLREEQQSRQAQEQRERQLHQWWDEGLKLKSVYPSFDLQQEVKNPEFLSMLRAGVPVQHAFEVMHMDQIKAGVAAMQAKATEKQVVAGIRAKGTRPQENGTAAQSAFTVKDDVSKLTRKDRAEIARRVERGEHVVF